MGLTFTWLFNTCFAFIGKVLGLIGYFASSSYSTVMPLMKNFFSDNMANMLVDFTNVFTGRTEQVFFASNLPGIFDSILNIVNQVVWWVLNLIVKAFRLEYEPFIFTVLAVFAVFFIPFFGFRFVRMIIS